MKTLNFSLESILFPCCCQNSCLYFTLCFNLMWNFGLSISYYILTFWSSGVNFSINCLCFSVAFKHFWKKLIEKYHETKVKNCMFSSHHWTFSHQHYYFQWSLSTITITIADLNMLEVMLDQQKEDGKWEEMRRPSHQWVSH